MLKQLTDIGKDKWMHFVLSLVGTMLFSAILAFANLKSLAIVIGGCLMLMIGVCKELRDRKHGGTPEVGDLIADFLGVFAGVCLCILLVAGFGVII